MEVEQALLLARSWLTHDNRCETFHPVATDDGYRADCTCTLRERHAVIDAALAAMPRASQQAGMDREAVARIIDPYAFKLNDMVPYAARQHFRDDALAKADAILALQPAQEKGNA